MNSKNIQQLNFENIESNPISNSSVIINKNRFLDVLKEIVVQKEINIVKKKVFNIKNILTQFKPDSLGLLDNDIDGDTISFRKDILETELHQVLESQTLERAIYYLNRLEKSIQKVKTNKINDINLHRWKEYDDIITDSLWILNKRDNSGAHLAWYWGNFVPQIPNQLMRRFTKKGNWVLDTFAGSGTTLIECRKLGRNGIGIELNQEVTVLSEKLIEKEKNKYNVVSDLVVGDSRILDLKLILYKYNVSKVQLIIMHPPYFDIIKFSDNQDDLSNSNDVDSFLKNFGLVIDNTTPYLEKGRYLALVIGDKYSKGEWIPLGFYCMQEVLKRDFLLKSIIVKNFDETRGKRNQVDLWRYRALVGGFYIFKHEYIMLFQKK